MTRHIIEDEIVEGNTEDEMSTEEEDFVEDEGDVYSEQTGSKPEEGKELQSTDRVFSVDQRQQGINQSESRPASRALSGPLETLPTLMENDDLGEDRDADDENEGGDEEHILQNERASFGFEEEAPPLPLAVNKKSSGHVEDQEPPQPPPASAAKDKEKRKATAQLNFETLMEDDRWFYIITKFGKEEMGPCSSEDLLKWAAQGLFPSNNVLVRHAATKWCVYLFFVPFGM